MGAVRWTKPTSKPISVRDLMQVTDADCMNVMPKFIQSSLKPRRENNNNNKTSDASGFWAANIKEKFMLYPGLQRTTPVSPAWVAGKGRAWRDGARCPAQCRTKIP